MDSFFWLGLAALGLRLGRFPRPSKVSASLVPALTTPVTTAAKSVSGNLPDLGFLAIIVPARNEEANIGHLLKSLLPLQKAGATVLVVDDQSSDRTAALAREFGVRVCQTTERPEGWSGKNWACHSGWLELGKTRQTFTHILFTDADTIHSFEQLPAALDWFREQGASLMTAVPYHRNPDFWEQLMGPFYLMILLITEAQQTKPKPNRFFSIGQFLLFRADHYEATQGHLAVKAELAEDLALANICFNHKKTFIVYPQTDLYSTRMYPTLKDFWKGWERNFRLGMGHSSIVTWIETILVIGSAIGVVFDLLLKTGTGPWNWLPYVLFAAAFGFLQRGKGKFSPLGALFYPLSLTLFILISISAKLKSALHQPIQWKKREYQK